MKVAELAGADLALWVARAEGHDDAFKWTDTAGRAIVYLRATDTEPYMPHEDGRVGAPLLDLHEVCIGRGQSSEYEVLRDFQGENPRPGQRRDRKYAIARLLDTETKFEADTALIAGCRAIVASVYGTEVSDV